MAALVRSDVVERHCTRAVSPEAHLRTGSAMHSRYGIEQVGTLQNCILI
jgi:hypothetical protein